MRMLVQVNFPVKEFNDRVRDGSAGTRIEQILGDLKPESAWRPDCRSPRREAVTKTQEVLSQPATLIGTLAYMAPELGRRVRGSRSHRKEQGAVACGGCRCWGATPRS